MSAAQSTLTAEQLATYLDLIDLPAAYRPAASPALDHGLLAALHKHHITTFPYENLALHYRGAGDGGIALDLASLATKFLAGRGRGGYCMENTLFFNHVLRTLGFAAYLTGARIRFREGGVPRGDYSGW
jgi:arylamine N-acetyltransferase